MGVGEQADVGEARPTRRRTSRGRRDARPSASAPHCRLALAPASAAAADRSACPARPSASRSAASRCWARGYIAPRTSSAACRHGRTVGRDQRRPLGDIIAGGVALRDEPVADLEHRDAPVRVDVGEELRRPRLALHDVIFAPVERLARRAPRSAAPCSNSPTPNIREARALSHRRPQSVTISSTILPTCSPDSMRACAAAASASGKIAVDHRPQPPALDIGPDRLARSRRRPSS